MAFWSLFSNRNHHQPITASWGKIGIAFLILGTCYVFGMLVAWKWPVTSLTQWNNWYGPYVGLVGALVLFASIVCLETRVLSGNSWPYFLIYGLGCLILTSSYLWEYSWPGLVLNAALAALTYGTLFFKLLRRWLENLWQTITETEPA